MESKALQHSATDSGTALKRVFGPIPVALSLIVLCGVIGLLLLSIQDGRASDQVFQRLNRSDSPLQVASATSRDTINLAQITRAWTVGSGTRRDVQIARAGLANRLNVTDSFGVKGGEAFDSFFGQPLDEFDQAFAGAPSGSLPVEDQDVWADIMTEPLRNLEDAAKQVLTKQQYLADGNALEIVNENKQLSWLQLLVAIAVVAVSGLLFVLVWTVARRNFRRANKILSDEQAQLKRSLFEIEQLKEFGNDESRILQLVLSGSSLQSVFSEIADLASIYSAGRPFRVSLDGVESRSGEFLGHEILEMSWPFEIERSKKTGVVQKFLWRAEIEEHDLLARPESTASNIDIGRRCAELAQIAASDSWARQKLKYEASHDPLTGLCNRAFLEQRMSHVLDERNSGGTGVALIFCDIDRFKLVNDSLGHKAGDRLLVNLAEWLRSAVDGFLRSPSGKATDILLSRFGGDEFVLLCTSDHVIEAALALGLRISELSRRPIQLEGIETFTDMSIGIAVANDQANTVESLLRNADVAMYRSKALGLGGPVLYSGEDETDRLEHLQTNTLLRRAFERDEFRLHLQPIIEFSTLRVVG
ncbi:MAG: diguanylate cyclase, partial [Microthrixaceae bacterium]